MTRHHESTNHIGYASVTGLKIYCDFYGAAAANSARPPLVLLHGRRRAAHGGSN
jgi:hypothetical protein